MASWADPDLPIVAAHRGLSAEQPENTVAAFAAAAEAGFRSLELDLRTTSDGEVVALHDPSLARTTNGSGRVAEMTYDELRGYETAAGPVPRFDDLLARFKHPDRLWNMETKILSAVEPSLRLLQHHGVVRQALHMSFQPPQLARSKELLPELARAFLIGHPLNDDAVATAKATGCTWIVADERTWTQERVRKAKDAGFHTGAYTINDPQRAVQLLEWGLGCVITDRRDVLQAVVQLREVLVEVPVPVSR